jgi:hypothetical protein
MSNMHKKMANTFYVVDTLIRNISENYYIGTMRVYRKDYSILVDSKNIFLDSPEVLQKKLDEQANRWLEKSARPIDWENMDAGQLVVHRYTVYKNKCDDLFYGVVHSKGEAQIAGYLNELIALLKNELLVIFKEMNCLNEGALIKLFNEKIDSDELVNDSQKLDVYTAKKTLYGFLITPPNSVKKVYIENFKTKNNEHE